MGRYIWECLICGKKLRKEQRCHGRLAVEVYTEKKVTKKLIQH